nr:hypothetical protein [Tanacetum cinerariifolium]
MKGTSDLGKNRDPKAHFELIDEAQLIPFGGVKEWYQSTGYSELGKPLSPDRVFDFPVDEPEPHRAYDCFAPGPLPGYAGNPNNNNNRWIEADVPLLGELGAKTDEPMAGLIVDEIVEPIVEMEEQMIALVIDVEEDIAMLFGDDNFTVQPPSVYEVGGSSTAAAAAEGPSFPLSKLGLLIPPSVIEDLSTCLGNLEYGLEQLVKKVGAQVEQGQQTVTQRDEEIARLTQRL